MSQSLEDKALHQLQQEQSKLLDKIDELRTIGVGGLVELPQLIVCGNQSSGKSSVLEAISRVRFPAKSNVCTRFATEVILRRNPSSKIKVSIEPGPSRKDEQERGRLRSFAYEAFSNGNDLPPLIEQAKEHMGITESVNAGFSDDVLKVEISGPDKPELTLVDLPGLYYSTSQEQDSQGILIVRKLTERYMKNPRSIILAVISAKTDYHLQEVLNIAERFDQKRERTLGIITQPDILEANSEEEDTYLQFIKNQKIHLEIGWHVLRNRSFETRDISDDARDEMEKAFFNQGRWTSLSRECVGIESLRRRLSTILLKLIRRNLPGLIAEIQDKVSDRRQQLSRLGPPRYTLQQQRGYLLNISSNFERIIVQALNGMYADEFFGGLDETGNIEDFRRLRAVIRQLNEYFADAMAIRGCRRKIVDRRPFPSKDDLQVASGKPYMDDWKPEYVERSSIEAEVSKQARNNRGIELPGNANQLLVGSLFRDQSKPWESLAKNHLMKAWESARYFALLVLQHITDDHTYTLLVGSIIDAEFEKLKQSLLDKLDELTAYTKRGHPLPVGKSFLSQIQKARSKRQLESLRANLPTSAFAEKGKTLFTMKDLEQATSWTEASRDEFAAAEIIDQMEAYYETAIVTFVDNVATLGIENCLLDPLQRIFTSQVVNNMDDDQIRELSMEQPYIHEERQRLGRELDKLQAGLRALSVFNTQKPSLGNLPLFIKRPVAGPSDAPSPSLEKSRPGPTIASASGNTFTVTESTAASQSPGPTKTAEPSPASVIDSAQALPAVSGTLSNTGLSEQKPVSGGFNTSSSEHNPVTSLFSGAVSEQKPIPLSGGFGSGSSEHKSASGSLFGGLGTGLSKQETVSNGVGTSASEHNPVTSLFSGAISEQKPIPLSGGFGLGSSEHKAASRGLFGGLGTSSSEHKAVPSLFGTGSSEHKAASGGFGGGPGICLFEQKSVSNGVGTSSSENKPVPGLFGGGIFGQKSVSGGFSTGTSTSTSTKPMTGTSTGTSTAVQQTSMGSTSKEINSPFGLLKVQDRDQNLMTHISAFPPFDKYSPEVCHPFDLLLASYANSDFLIMMNRVAKKAHSLSDFLPLDDEDLERTGAGGSSKGDEVSEDDFVLSKTDFSRGAIKFTLSATEQDSDNIHEAQFDHADSRQRSGFVGIGTVDRDLEDWFAI
ncbi:hypothetical protein CNMCM7691_000115 [Aspergillus felis]|uniref:Dynamin family protein n=1 Tax=Aspergillus felis TaxID=1287682 RepID=A0A8H6QXE4_9EURO|nr:hypothetical protein CNMCM7691_000115 [Aspergillus felis]